MGLTAGWVDWHNDEVQATVLCLLVFGFVMGLWRARPGWLWGLILGVGVPSAHLAGHMLGYVEPFPLEPNTAASLLALVPAFIGVYSGVLLRKVAALV